MSTQTNQLKTAAIYARVSTDEQAYNYSLQTQIDGCREKAAKLGISVIGEPFREDYTGTKLDRPELDKLRGLIESGQIDTVIVYELDRLARKSSGQSIIEAEFKRQGVEIVYAMYDFPDTPNGNFNKTILSAVAELEREQILERMNRGKKGKAKGGEVVTTTIVKYGYKPATAEGDRDTLAIDEQESRIVMLMFDWVLTENIGNVEIARRLKDMSIPTRYDDREKKGKKTKDRFCWNISTISDILRDEIYTGVWYYGRTETINGKRIPRDKNDWIAVPVPSIIPRDIWDRVQEVLKSRSGKHARNVKREYLLRGRITCGLCGRAMCGTPKSGREYNGVRKTYLYYRCGGRDRFNSTDHKTICNCAGVKELLDNAVWSTVVELLKNPANLLRGLRERQKAAESENARLIRQRGDTIGEIAKTEKLLSGFIDMRAGGELSKDHFLEKKVQAEKKIAGLRGELADIDSKLGEFLISEDDLEFVQEQCELLKARAYAATDKQKQAIFSVLNVTVIATPGEMIGRRRSVNLVVRGYFGDTFTSTAGGNTELSVSPIPFAWCKSKTLHKIPFTLYAIAA